MCRHCTFCQRCEFWRCLRQFIRQEVARQIAEISPPAPTDHAHEGMTLEDYLALPPEEKQDPQNIQVIQPNL